ncbi:MAG: uracil phosphoribosyltransferase [Rhizobiales bacterium PAR1]|nr:MAG: uracil phosphoribosyltransferase [Rhizobiales bacterium PAR1]
MVSLRWWGAILKSSDRAKNLLSAAAVRTRTRRLYDLGVAGKLEHFVLHLDRLPALAARVATVTRAAYPDLKVPFHARWRHFVHAGEDRWARLAAETRWPSPAERARAAFDLAIVSVLLDAGAGPTWRYRDPATGVAVGRSEGLALASFDMFAAGAFSANPNEPLRADAKRLAAFTSADIAKGFQVGPENPLEGLEGRAGLINALGQVLLASTLRDADGAPRPGALFDLLIAAHPRAVPAAAILEAVLAHLGPIWPSRLSLGSVPLGDCWRYPALQDGTEGSDLVPFHKLSQWLSYSLIEPIVAAGLSVEGIDALTGLAEYRNGGLFLDGGVIMPKDAALLAGEYRPESTVIIEWRALTVALLDEIAPLVRNVLGVSVVDFPLAKVLEGGTWATGRQLAREARADGGPPLRIVSDGTVF